MIIYDKFNTVKKVHVPVTTVQLLIINLWYQGVFNVVFSVVLLTPVRNVTGFVTVFAPDDVSTPLYVRVLALLNHVKIL